MNLEIMYSNFVDLVPEDEVMEYSDYVFGLILKLTKVQYNSYFTSTQLCMAEYVKNCF